MALKKHVTRITSKQKAGTDQRDTVYKGFYIYADQYNRLLQQSAYNKIHSTPPFSSSDIIREALDEYFAKQPAI